MKDNFMQFSEILFNGGIAWIEEFEGRNPNTWNLYSTHWVNSHKRRLVHSEWRKYINLRIGKYFFPSREIFTTHFSCQSLSEQMGKGCGEWFSWNLENRLMIFSNFCIWSFWFLDKTNNSNVLLYWALKNCLRIRKRLNWICIVSHIARKPWKIWVTIMVLGWSLQISVQGNQRKRSCKRIFIHYCICICIRLGHEKVVFIIQMSYPSMNFILNRKWIISNFELLKMWVSDNCISMLLRELTNRRHDEERRIKMVVIVKMVVSDNCVSALQFKERGLTQRHGRLQQTKLLQIH